MKTSDDSNQAEVRTKGHISGGDMSDPHLHTTEGEKIGLTTNFGVRHAGFIKDSEGLNQTK